MPDPKIKLNLTGYVPKSKDKLNLTGYEDSVKKKVATKSRSQEELWGSNSQPQDLYTSLATGVQEEQQASDGLDGVQPTPKPTPKSTLFPETPMGRPTSSVMYEEKKPVLVESLPIEAKPKKFYRLVADEKRDVEKQLLDLEERNARLGRRPEDLTTEGTYQALQQKKVQLDEEFEPARRAIKQIQKQAADFNAPFESIVSGMTQGKYSYLSTEVIKLDKEVEDKLIDKFDSVPEEIKSKWYKGGLPVEAKEEIINSAKIDVFNEKYKNLKIEAEDYIKNIKNNPNISSEDKIKFQKEFKAKNDDFNAQVAIDFSGKLLKNNFKKTKESEDLDEGILSKYEGFIPETIDVLSTFTEGMAQTVAKSATGIPSAVLLLGERFNQLTGMSKPEDYTAVEQTIDFINDTTNYNFLPSSKSEKGDIVNEDGLNINLYSIGKTLAKTLPFTMQIMNEVKKGRIEGTPQSMISQLINPKYNKQFADNLRATETAYKVTIGDNYNEAKKMGMDDSKAFTYANVMSLAEGVSENIMPDFKYFDSLTGSSLKNLFKGNLKEAATKQAIKNVTKDFFKNISSEIGEEEFTLAVEDGLKYSLLLNHKNSEFFNINKQKELMATTIIMSGAMGGFAAKDKFKQNRDDIYMDVYKNISGIQDTFINEINSPLTDNDTKKTLIEAYKYANDISSAIANSPENVTADQVDLLVQKKKLEEKKKGIDPAFHPDINEEIATIDTKIRDLSNAPAVQEVAPVAEEAVKPTELSKETKPVSEEVVSEDVTEKPVETTEAKAKAYSEELDKTKEADPDNYWSVSPVSAEDAAKGTIIDTEDGSAIVKPDGDIAGLFKKTTSKAKGVAQDLLKRAVAAGGKKLDNFDTYLTPQYIKAGFRVVSRTPFNEEYAPEGWNKEKHGTPDVVAMVYDPEGKLDIEEKTFDDYDEAIAYRDAAIVPSIETELEGLSKLFDESDNKYNDTQVDKAKAALKQVLPGTEIIIHNTTEEYNKAVGDKSRGAYIKYSDGRSVIHVNKQKANGRTVAHEVFHAVILDKIKGDKSVQDITARMMKAVYKTASPALREELDNFAEMYSDESIRDEEKLSELIGIIAEGYPEMSPANKGIIKRWLDALAKTFGLKPFTDNEVIDMLNTLARKVSTGEVVSEQDLDIFKGGKKVDIPSDGLTKRSQYGNDKVKIDIKYLEQDRVEELKEKGLLTEPENLSFLNGKKVVTTSPDDMLVGSIFVNGKEVATGNGGVYFVTKFGDVWANSNKAVANGLAKAINETYDPITGKSYLVLVKGTDAKLVSSPQGVTSSLAVTESMIDAGLFSLSDFRSAVRSAVKSNGGDILLSPNGSAKTLKSEVDNFFKDVTSSTFEKRGNVLRDIVSNLAKSESAKINKTEIIKFLNGNESKGLGVGKTEKSQSLIDLIATTSAEKLTKGLSTGDIYAVIEIDGKVKVVQDSHQSYPYHIKIVDENGNISDKKPILILPKNRRNGKEILTSVDGKTAKELGPGFSGKVGATANMPYGKGIIMDDSVSTIKRSQKIEWEESKIGKGDRAIIDRNPVLENAANRYANKEISTKEYLDIKDKTSPISPITDFIEPAKEEDIRVAVGTKSEGKTNLSFEKGKLVGLRLDIPAYVNKNIWAITVHEPNKGAAISYNNVARIGKVTFESNPKVALDIARKKISKGTIARMNGEWIPIEGKNSEEKGKNAMKFVESIINSPEWSQVGMNPFRHSWFYDRADGKPVLAADELIQIGGLVYAKNVVKTTPYDKAFEFIDKEGDVMRFQQAKGIDEMVKIAKKAKYTDAAISAFLKAKGYSIQNITNAILSYDKKYIEARQKEEGVFTREGRNKLITSLDSFKRMFLSARSFLSKTTFIAKEGIDAGIKAQSKIASYLVSDLDNAIKKYDGDKEKLISDFDKFIRGEEVELPDNFIEIGNAMRNHVDKLSYELIKSGTVDEYQAENIKKNIGSYLNRSYEIFDKENWASKVDELTLQSAKNYLKKQLLSEAIKEAKESGLDVDILLEKKANQAIANLLNKENAQSFVSSGKTGSKDVSILKEKSDIPLEIRALMGEYTDPAQNYSRTIFKIASLVNNAKFLNTVKSNGMNVYLFKEKTGEFNTQIAGKESETMNPLNGLYTTKEMAGALKESAGILNTIETALPFEIAGTVKSTYEYYIKLLGSVKYLKTIGSVGTHFKNVSGNVTFMLANGYFKPDAYRQSAKAIYNDFFNKTDKELREKMQEYIEAGIVDQSAVLGELRSMFKDDDFDKSFERRMNSEKLNPANSFIDKIKRLGKKVMSTAENAYQAEDDYFKIVAYETEKSRYSRAIYKKEYSELSAIEKKDVTDKVSEMVKNILPNYGRVAGAVKMVKAFPVVGTFISFQTEALRTAYNIVNLSVTELKSSNPEIKKIGALRMTGIISSQAVKYAVMYLIGGAVLGDDDDEKKEKAKEFVAPWSKNSNIVITDESNGKFSYVDFSASDPFGGIVKPMNAALGGEDLLDGFVKGLEELVAPFTTPDILRSMFSDILENKNSYGGTLYNPSDSFENKSSAIVARVYKTFEPGTVTSIRKISGSDSPLNEMAGQFTGYKSNDVDIIKDFGFKISAMKKKEIETRSIYNRAVNKFKNKEVTDAELQAAYLQSNKATIDNYKELKKSYDAALYFGTDRKEIKESMKDAYVSADVIRGIVTGKFKDLKKKKGIETDAQLKARNPLVYRKLMIFRAKNKK